MCPKAYFLCAPTQVIRWNGPSATIKACGPSARKKKTKPNRSLAGLRPANKPKPNQSLRAFGPQKNQSHTKACGLRPAKTKACGPSARKNKKKPNQSLWAFGPKKKRRCYLSLGGGYLWSDCRPAHKPVCSSPQRRFRDGEIRARAFADSNPSQVASKKWGPSGSPRSYTKNRYFYTYPAALSGAKAPLLQPSSRCL